MHRLTDSKLVFGSNVICLCTRESHAMYLSRPPDALKSLIRLYVGLRTGYDLGYIAFCIQIKLFCSISSVLEPQSKSWIVELELELSAP